MPTHDPEGLTTSSTSGSPPLVTLVLDLLRHGHALPADEGGDALRPLSPRGRTDLERLGHHLRASGWCPDRAFASPFTRARESARVTLHAAGLTLEPEIVDALRPDSHPGAVLEALAAERITSGHVLLVGHQPLLGLLAALLTGGPPPPFATAGFLRIGFHGMPAPGQGQPSLVLSPGSG